MKYEEIIKLLDAGYSRSEILEMNEAPAEETPAPDAPAPAADNVSEVLSEMKEMFNEMRKEFTAMNILSASQPAETERTPDEIMATIINPEVKKKK